MSRVRTPSQTVGPYLSLGMAPLAGPELVAADVPGALELEGVLFDGAGIAVPDGMVELFQADPEGRFPPDSEPGWSGFGRCLTDETGHFSFRTVRPGPVALDGGEPQAPHLELLVFARGMLRPVRTRCYFPDDSAANALDPVLSAIDERRRETLVGRACGPGRFRFDVVLQGEGETVFFGC